MTVYLDNDFKCHVTDDGTMAAYETDIFDGKCSTYIEGYRLVPEGEKWTRPDGVVFAGLMVAPWKPYANLAVAQAAYEKEELERLRLELADTKAALATLGVTDVE